VAVFMVTLASPNTETHSRPSPARLQADLKTLAAALRYVLESERDGVTALASNSAPVRQPLGEMSNSVAYTFPSNQPGLPGKILTNGSARS